MPRRILYQPGSARPFRLSRSKVELFLSCPRCFYLDRRLGISRPASFPFNLNSAVDTLLKAEFDQYREAREPHPYMTEAGLDAIPALFETHGHMPLPPYVQRPKGGTIVMADLDRDTVEFEPNYDESRTQPTVLPSRFPNLLCNGSDGIAVGMATSLPPHNLREVATARGLLGDQAGEPNQRSRLGIQARRLGIGEPRAE